MKPTKVIVVTCFALLISSAMGLTLAGAAEPTPDETAPTAPEVTPETPGVTPLAAQPCYANVICAYFAPWYEGINTTFACSASGLKHLAFGLYDKSAKNRCGNKTNWLRLNGATVACMNPGGNRPNPGWFNEVFIAKYYGAYC